jgi:hypothetical protein
MIPINIPSVNLIGPEMGAKQKKQGQPPDQNIVSNKKN